MSKATCMDMDGYDLYLLGDGGSKMLVGHFETKADMDYVLKMHYINPLRDAGGCLYDELANLMICGIVKYGDSWFYDPYTALLVYDYYRRDFNFCSYKYKLYC